MPESPQLCVVCSDPVDPATAHTPHEPDCPNNDHTTDHYDCLCDAVAHPECCPAPQCAPQKRQAQ